MVYRFLVQMRIDVDGNITKGTTDYVAKTEEEAMSEAMLAWHTAHSSARAKQDTEIFTTVILDEKGLPVVASETYEKPKQEG